jgi:hypothetical protein
MAAIFRATGKATGKAAGKSALRAGGKATGRELVQAGGKSLLKKAASEVAKKSTKEAAEKVFREAAEKVSKEAAKEAAEKVAKEVSKEAAEKVAKEVAKEAAEKVAKEVAKEASEKLSKEAAEKVAKEASEKLSKEVTDSALGVVDDTVKAAADQQDSFLKKFGSKLWKNKKLVAAFATAAALGGYALSEFEKKKDFKLKIVNIETYSEYLIKVPSKLIITVEPVNGKMIELAKNANILFNTSTTTPSLNGLTFPITEIYPTGVRFMIDITTMPNFEKLVINSPVSGECLYKTSFLAEVGNVIANVTTKTAETVGGVAGGLFGAAAAPLSEKLGNSVYVIYFIFFLIIILIIYMYVIKPYLAVRSIFGSNPNTISIRQETPNTSEEL